ncbi:MAG: hypothetical protein RLY14_3096, partial [Planctomycetota bacterium]
MAITADVKVALDAIEQARNDGKITAGAVT